MRIILDTDKKTITVPWNYQDKLNAMNAMIMEVTGDETKKKTFKGYINDIWNECMNDSDKHVVTARSPRSRTRRTRKTRNNIAPEVVRIT